MTFWKDMSKYLQGQKYIILALLLAFQAGIFLMLKLYFFSYFEKEMDKASSSSASSEASQAASTSSAEEASDAELLLRFIR